MYQWITAKEVAAIAGCCMPNARLVIKEVNEEIRQQGGIVPVNHKAPKEIVLKKLGLKGE